MPLTRLTSARVTGHILVVEDEPSSRRLMGAMLEALGHRSTSLADGLHVIPTLQASEPPVDLVLLDVMLPGMDGYQVLQQIREHWSHADLPVIMATTLDSRDDRLAAVAAGANDFISKPIERVELGVRLEAHLKLKYAQDALHRYQSGLEELVQERTSALSRALREVTEAQELTLAAHLETIQRLAIAAEYRDEQTALHVQRMSHYSACVARAAGMAEADVELLLRAAPMHDVGKIGIPDAILLKRGRLTEEEMAVMRSHTVIGGRILSGSSSPLLQMGETIALTHHERWDGQGYPHRLAGEAIPIWSRACAVADVFDALTTERPYKPEYSLDEAGAIIRDGRGTHFDPQMVDAFFDAMDEILEIYHRFRG